MRINNQEVKYNRKNLEQLLLNKKLLHKLKQDIKKPINIIDLSDKYDLPPYQVKYILDYFTNELKYNIIYDETTQNIALETEIQTGGHHIIDLSKLKNKTYKFGFVSDDHLCNKAERLDVLNALFDIFVDEGITQVFNAGNWIDGESRFNKLDIHIFGLDNQIDYFIENYPYRKGIKISFIAGDDHEGWYQQREGIIIGEHLEQRAKKSGRDDLEYLGYIEADIEFKTTKGSTILRLFHPGGGTAYALSYALQRHIESLSGGDKPHILCSGHYHKAEFLPSYRNIRVIQGGTTCDQTRFMRKHRIEAHVGGWIVEFQQSEDGAVSRIKAEFISFFDKEYYRAKKYYK